MNRSRAIELLTRSKPILADRYGVTHLALLGSTARDTAGNDSDVDILVAFDGPASRCVSAASSSPRATRWVTPTASARTR